MRNGPQFFETVMGNKFFNSQLPKLINALVDVGKELKRANDLKEQELNGNKNNSKESQEDLDS